MMNTETRYFGKVCEKHPELNGERMKANRACVRCHNERGADYRQRNKEKVTARGAGYRQRNKEELAAQGAEYRQRNKEKRIEYYQQNKEKIAARSAARYQKNKEKIAARSAARYQKNKEKIAARSAVRYQQNKDKVAARLKQKRAVDPAYALERRVRARMQMIFKRLNLKKPAKTNAMLGCDWATLEQHFESLFVDGMSWDNRHLWHVDHIVPLASASTEQELVALCHYTNLQPLWAEDNISKGCKILPIFNRSTPNESHERVPQF